LRKRNKGNTKGYNEMVFESHSLRKRNKGNKRENEKEKSEIRKQSQDCEGMEW